MTSSPAERAKLLTVPLIAMSPCVPLGIVAERLFITAIAMLEALIAEIEV